MSKEYRCHCCDADLVKCGIQREEFHTFYIDEDDESLSYDQFLYECYKCPECGAELDLDELGLSV